MRKEKKKKKNAAGGRNQGLGLAPLSGRRCYPLIPCTLIKNIRRIIYTRYIPNTALICYCLCFSPADWEKLKLTKLPSTSILVMDGPIHLNCIRHPALAGVSFGSHCCSDSNSVSCPYRRSPLLLRRRKL